MEDSLRRQERERPTQMTKTTSIVRAFFVTLACAVVSCTQQGEERVGTATSAILNGRASGADEDAAVYIESAGESGTLRCSGYLVAPSLVVTARHCLIRQRAGNLHCNIDGSPVDLGAESPRLQSPESVTVFIGQEKGSQRTVAARELLANVDVTVCRSDLAFIVLVEPGLDVRTPLRREPVRPLEKFRVSGWGYTSDARDALPSRRSTLDDITVTDVGPGRIPAGTFATSGNSLCLGDSGAAALIDGAVVGVYSRIEPEPVICSNEFSRNVFAAIVPYAKLAERAYAAIGETPWYAGEPPPWLLGEGEACVEDSACRSGACDATSSTCAPACGDSGLACHPGQVCKDEECVDVPPPAAASGCSISSGLRCDATVYGASCSLAVGLMLVRARRRSRA